MSTPVDEGEQPWMLRAGASRAEGPDAPSTSATSATGARASVGAQHGHQHDLWLEQLQAPGQQAAHGQVTLPVSRWQTQYQRVVVASDLVAVIAVSLLGLAVLARDGQGERTAAMAMITTLALVVGLAVCRAWELRVLGQGTEEFRRLGQGAIGGGVVLALAALAVDQPDLRPWVFGVVPVVLAVAAPLRYLLRQVLHRQRQHGRCMLPVLAAGNVDEVADLVTRTRREFYNGWMVEAVCTPGGLGQDGVGVVADVPVVGDLDHLADRVVQGGYRVVAVVPDPHWTRRRLQYLSWELETTAAEMVVAPVLMEVTGPRLNVSPVFGLPLLRVAAPRFDGARWVIKSMVDRVASAVGLLIIMPVLVGIACAIWLDDRGPVLYRQVRVGRGGQCFRMIKFRSMVVDADTWPIDLVGKNEAAGPLFKMRRDPRITRVGVFLRRYSLDELPQLFNVLVGNMSLVGPRPPLPTESEKYPPNMRRRLKVKPGLTGLWQISGRSDLSWDESVRLDVRYVEDWSLTLDLTILWKTFRAVISGNGAY